MVHGARRVGCAGFALLVVVALAAGCSSTGESSTTTQDGGTGPAGPYATGSAALICPSPPTRVSLATPAPVWDGLLIYETTVEGAFDSLEVEIFDPVANVWTETTSTTRQRGDGRYATYVQPVVRDEIRDKELKLRGRTKLIGCVPSAWVETQPFRLNDALVNTTWTATIDAADAVSQFAANGVGTPTRLGPYSIATPLVHSLRFNADGSTTESLNYTIKSGHVGDVYDGCTFDFQITGNWKYTSFAPSDPLRVLISRKKVVLGPTSKCTIPLLTELLINQPGFQGYLPDATWRLNVDYTPLLDAPAGKPFLDQPGQALGSLVNFSFALTNDAVAPDTAALNGAYLPNAAHYEKQ